MNEYSSFQDVLGEQMRRAPYVIASLVAHFMIALVVAGIMILAADESVKPPQLVAAPPPPIPDVEEEPVMEDPIEPIEPTEEPVEITETPTEDMDLQDLVTGDIDAISDAPFESQFIDNTVGLGDPPGGKLGTRGGRQGGGGTPKSETSVIAALQWLADHQSPEGYWDADEFMFYDAYPNQPSSTGKGNPVNDVGLTGLALLALQGHGNTQVEGEHKEKVASGIAWLREVQQDNGLFGEEVGNSTLYNHAIATMAMGEAYYFSNRSLVLKPNMKRAVSLIHHARANYGAWRYDLESDGSSDTSITGWMIFALKTAEENNLAVDKAAYASADTWFQSIEDRNTGRTGYTFGEGGAGIGSMPSRPVDYVERFPAEKSEALTAVALLSRIFMTDGEEVRRWSEHPQYELMKKQANLIANKPPHWDEGDGSIDMYYWYYGTYAMNQWGGSHWKNWKKSIEKALIPHQRLEHKEDNFYGSWDPIGAWGRDGGRVYSTALCALILEVYYRYNNVLGAR